MFLKKNQAYLTARFQRKLNSPKRKGPFGWPGNIDSETGKGKAVHRLFIKNMKKKAL